MTCFIQANGGADQSVRGAWCSCSPHKAPLKLPSIQGDYYEHCIYIYHTMREACNFRVRPSQVRVDDVNSYWVRARITGGEGEAEGGVHSFERSMRNEPL